MSVRGPRWRLTPGVVALAMLSLLPQLAQGAEDAPKPKKKYAAGGPQLQYERFRRKIAFQVEKKRDQQIEGLKRLLDMGGDENEIPDLKFRLGELYYEKAQFYFFRGNEAEDAALRAKSPPARESARAEKKRYLREHKIWLQRALNLYQDIREKYPKYARMPEVLFALGQSYWSQQRFQSAIEAYAELIRNFRDSPLVAEAWLAFGEFYFDEGDIHKALKSYEKAAEDKRSRVYGFALYKQAWCYYNLGEWRQALRKFESTVMYSQLAEELSGENKIALGREAQKDWIRAYAHIGNAKRAPYRLAELLDEKQCRSPRCLKLLEQLAKLWMEQGNFDASAYTYREIMRVEPNSPRAAYYQAEIVDLVSRSGDKDRVIAETRRMIKVMARVEANMKNLKGDKLETAKTDIEDAKTSSEVTIRRMAQMWNREAMKTRRERTYKQARQLYEIYLELYPKSEYTYEMRFQFADLLYRVEEFDAAAKNYKATVLANPKGKYLADAANDNILAIEEYIKDLGVRRPKLKGDKPAPLHAQKQRLVEACDRYLKYVPEPREDEKGAAEATEKRVAVRFKAAKVFYNHNHHDEALKRLDAIVQEEPGSQQAEYAANLVIDIYNLKGDWEQLYKAASGYRAMSALVDGRPKLAEELRNFGEYAKFKMVHILEEKVKKEKGDLALVGEAYEEFYREFPKSKNADKALFNASVAFDRAGQEERANELRRRLLAEYPNSPLGVDVALYLAQQYEERTEFLKAAKAYLDFVKKHPEDKRARNAMYNAAVFYAGMGRVSQANRLREDYLKNYGKMKGGEKEASDLYWAMAQDLDRARRWRKAAQAYAAYSKAFPRTDRMWDARWREAELLRTKLRSSKEAEKLEGKLLGTYFYRKKRGQKLPDEARRRASQVRFRIVDADRKDYVKMRVYSPNLKSRRSVTRFKRSLKEKAQARDRLIRRYTRVVTRFQQAESTVAALYRIAQTWDEFVESLTKLRCPFRDEEACMAFRSGIDETAAPARESAYKAYKTCVDKSNELNTFTAYSNKCVKQLEKLAPDAFPEIVEVQMKYDPAPELEGLSGHPLMLRAPSKRKAHAEVPGA